MFICLNCRCILNNRVTFSGVSMNQYCIIRVFSCSTIAMSSASDTSLHVKVKTGTVQIVGSMPTVG